MKPAIIFFILASVFTSCKEDSGFPDSGDNDYGAFMNVISVDSGPFSTFPGTIDLDTANEFVVTLEERDSKKGGLLKSYDFYVSHKDNYDVNGTKSDTLLFLKSVPASVFSIDPVTGYPRVTISVTAVEILAALGYGNVDVNGGDFIDFKEVLILTDGREFTGTNSSSIAGGIHFTSPFFHRIPVACASSLVGSFTTSSTSISADNCSTPFPCSAGCPEPVASTITLTEVPGEEGKYIISDASFGQYNCAWSDSNATGVFLHDACGKLSFSGSDQYGFTYNLKFVSNDGQNLIITWSNDFGDTGRTTLTAGSPGFWPLGLN